MWHRAYSIVEKTQADTNIAEPPFIASNETVLNVEHVCGSVGIGDGVADMCFILGVDPQTIATKFALDVDTSFIEPEFMPDSLEVLTKICLID
jgi:hypothetical protein